MSSPQLIVIRTQWDNKNYYGELFMNSMIVPTSDRDIRTWDCRAEEASPEWASYIQSILPTLVIKQSDGTRLPIRGSVSFKHMCVIKNTGYSMPIIDVYEPQDAQNVLQRVGIMPRQPKQCIAPPKPVAAAAVPVASPPTVKRVHISCPGPIAEPIRRAPVRPPLTTSKMHRARGRSDSCDSTGAVHHFGE